MCDEFNIDVFRQRLVETQRFYAHLSKLPNSGEKLWATIIDTNLSLNITRNTDMGEIADAQRYQVAGQVFDTRLRFIQQANLEKEEFRYSGQFLVFFPEEGLNDGTSQVASDGFFGYYNLPPPALWLYYLRTNEVSNPTYPHMICWIPDETLELVKNTIATVPDLSLIMLEHPNFNSCYKQVILESLQNPLE